MTSFLQDPESVKIPEKVFFKIGDVAQLLGVKPYVLRYWESEFPILNPEKAQNGQRVYRRGDVENLLLIKHLLYQEKYSIEGARKRIRDLRKDGELKDYKQEKLLGGEETIARHERLKKIYDLAKDLHEFSKQPLQELFKA